MLTRRDFSFSGITAALAALFGVCHPRCNTAAGEASDLNLSQPEVCDPAAGDGPCPRCGQIDLCQFGEYPCKLCGLPTLHDDDPQPDEFAEKDPNCIDVRHMPGAPSDLYIDCFISRRKHYAMTYVEKSRTRPLSRQQAAEMVKDIEAFYVEWAHNRQKYPRLEYGWPQSHTIRRLVKGNRVIVRLSLQYVKIVGTK